MIKVELADGWCVMRRGDLWTLDYKNVTVMELEGCGTARDAAQASARYLKDVAAEVEAAASIVTDDEDAPEMARCYRCHIDLYEDEFQCGECSRCESCCGCEHEEDGDE